MTTHLILDKDKHQVSQHLPKEELEEVDKLVSMGLLLRSGQSNHVAGITLPLNVNIDANSNDSQSILATMI